MSARIGIVAGAYHVEETEAMIAFATEECSNLGHNVTSVVKVPGAFEIPLATKRMLDSGNYDGIITIGIIEKGETLHGKSIGDSVISALTQMQLETGIPIGLGIIGPGALPEHIQPRVEKHARAAANAVSVMLY